MSDAYEGEGEAETGAELVAEGSTSFERVVDGVLGLCLMLFVLSGASLIRLTSLGTELAGLTLPRLFGLVLLFVGVGLVGVGLASRYGSVETEPSATSGLAAGVAFGVVGSVLGIILAGLTLGYGSPVWLVLALGVAFGFSLLTIVPREDLGSTIPAALAVLSAGAALASGVLDIGWVWNPAFLSGGFTGVAVIPVATAIASLIGGWAAAKARAGFGARGRQLGAYYLIYTNAMTVIAVMVLVVLFVAKKGAGFAFQQFSIGPLAALAVLAIPLVVLGRRVYGGLAFDSASAATRSLLQLGMFGVFAAGAASSLYVLATQSAVGLFGLEIRPVQFVGAWLLTIVGALLTAYLWRLSPTARAGDGVGSLLKRTRTWFGRAAAVLLVAFLAGFAFWGGSLARWLALANGLVLAPVAAYASFAFLALPVVLAVRAEGAVTDALENHVATARVGVAASLVLGLFAILLEMVAGMVPAFADVSVVPAVALLGALGSGLLALWTAVVADRGAPLRGYASLGAVGFVGGLTLTALHVALTGDIYLGVVGISPETAVEWPFVMRSKVPLGDELSGILPAIVGTFWLVVGASLFAVPLGIGAAIFLTEYAEQGRFTAVVETATNALWSTPSVVFGLFGGAFIVPRLGGDTTLMAGMLVLGFMLLPLVLITSREAIKSVPDEYRDASAALGVNEWETIRSVVLPAAMPGIITGVVLGVGRIAGETAPLILVLGSQISALSPVKIIDGFRFTSQPPFVANDALLSGTTALPTKIWAIFKVPGQFEGGFTYGWGTAFVLLGVVLSFYAIGIASRRYFRRKLRHE